MNRETLSVPVKMLAAAEEYATEWSLIRKSNRITNEKSARVR